MAVAHDVSSESAVSSGGTTVTWNHSPVGTPRAALVFVFQSSDEQNVTGVTYNGESLTPVSGGSAVQSTGETGRCDAYFNGGLVTAPSPPDPVVISRANNSNQVYGVAITLTSNLSTTLPLEVYTPGIIIEAGNGDLTENNISDSASANSMRYAGLYWGGASSPSTGSSTVALHSEAPGSHTFNCVRESAAGQGSRPVGWNYSGTDQARAGVYLAVREPHSALIPANLTLVRDVVGLASHLAQVNLPLAFNRTVVPGSQKFGSISIPLGFRSSAFYPYTIMPNPWKDIPHVGPLIDALQQKLAALDYNR